MTAVLTRFLLLAGAVLSLIACSTEGEKQWYKPGSNYTVKDFERDEAACTSKKALNEACLKERGWVPLSADREKPVPAPAPPPRGGARY